MLFEVLSDQKKR